MMTPMDSPPAFRDHCVWCGARPLRGLQGEVVTWAPVGHTKGGCDHETVASR